MIGHPELDPDFFDPKTTRVDRSERSDQMLGRTEMSTGRRHYELLPAPEFYMNTPPLRECVFCRRV